MRSLLLPGLLKRVTKDISSQKPIVRLFEIGTVYHPVNKWGKPLQFTHICGVSSDSSRGEIPTFYDPPHAVNISDAQGVVESLLD